MKGNFDNKGAEIAPARHRQNFQRVSHHISRLAAPLVAIVFGLGVSTIAS
jgi:hypothetical protein